MTLVKQITNQEIDDQGRAKAQTFLVGPVSGTLLTV